MADHKQRAYKERGLQQLRSFCVVCEQGGYAAAARKLLLTSPAVWEQMQELERHYGMRLLEPAGHGVRPTAAGERLLGMVRPLLASLDSTRSVLAQEERVSVCRLIDLSIGTLRSCNFSQPLKSASRGNHRDESLLKAAVVINFRSTAVRW